MSKFLRFALLALVLNTGLAFAANSVKLRAPDDKSTVSQLSTAQRLAMFLPIDQVRKLWEDSIFMKRISQEAPASKPKGIQFEWKYAGDDAAASFVLQVSENDDMADAKSFPAKNGFTLYNLQPGGTYYWKVCALDGSDGILAESPVRSFTVEDTMVNVLYWQSRLNVRDIGGMRGTEGRRLAYGKLYRTGQFTGSEKPVPNSGVFNPVVIKTELDLRWKGGEASGIAPDLDPSQVEYMNVPALFYATLYAANGMKNYAELFRIFTKPENYPINFHCAAGADRTGTLAFLLEAVLGCDPDEIRRDYVFTSFYSTRHFSSIEPLIARMLGEENLDGDGEFLRRQAERFLMRCGVSSEEILAFQRIMLGDDLAESDAIRERLEAERFISGFTGPSPLDFKEYVVDGIPVVQCGKTYSILPPICNYVEPVLMGSDASGRILAYIENPTTNDIHGVFKGEGAADEYALVSPMEKRIFKSPDGGVVWSREALASNPITVKPQQEFVIVFDSTIKEIPEGYTVADITATNDADANTHGLVVATSQGGIPVIDGNLDDEIWKSQTPIQLNTISGKPATERHSFLYLGTNEEHDTLYVAAKIEDNTPNAPVRPRDGEAWADDDFEIFISCTGDSKYCHVVFNRACSLYDASGSSASATWNLKGYEAKTAEVEGGWVIEMALPLDQFELTNVLEINVCTTDTNGPVQRNLGTTDGAFHNRGVFKQVMLK